MKKILLIATGGTIASKESNSGLVPQITSEELLEFVPEISNICTVEALQLFNLDSTNIYYPHWQKIEQCVEEHYDKYDGFVITHGTDTLAYTAAALSYLIQNSKKPIVLTGAQRSVDRKDTDARENLYQAFLYAVDDKAYGVHIVFNGKVIIGTRAKKIRTKSYDAFSPIDYPETAVFRNDRLIHYIDNKKEEMTVKFYHRMNPAVFVWKLIPGADAGFLQHIKDQYDALIIESFGVGGIPFYENRPFIDGIEEWLRAGKKVIITTQVQHEGSDMKVYQVGCEIKKKLDLMEAYDMTIEAVITKTMWCLGISTEAETFRRNFYEPVEHDIF